MPDEKIAVVGITFWRSRQDGRDASLGMVIVWGPEWFADSYERMRRLQNVNVWPVSRVRGRWTSASRQRRENGHVVGQQRAVLRDG